MADVVAMSRADAASSAALMTSGGSSSVSAPASGIVGGVHGATVGLGDLPDDRQPEPRAGQPARARARDRSGRTRAEDPPRRSPDRGRAPRARPCAHAHLDRPAGRARMAPLAGVVEQVRDRAVKPRRRGAHEAGLGVEDEAAVVGRAAAHARSRRRRPDPGARPRPRPSRRRSLRDRPDRHQHGQLAQLRPARRRAPARAHALGSRIADRERVEVGLHAGQRRAQLVRGVGDELALGQARALERREHRVEAGRQPPELVLLAGRRCGGRGPAYAPRARRRRVRRRTGTSAARDTSSPSAAASAIPPRHTSASTSSRRASVLSTSVSGKATCHTPLSRRALGQNPHVRAGDGRVAEEGGVPARGHAPACAAVTGSSEPFDSSRSTCPSERSSCT